MHDIAPTWTIILCIGCNIKNKLDKPYKRIQSQGQGHVKKWPTVVASVMLIACLAAEIKVSADVENINGMYAGIKQAIGPT